MPILVLYQPQPSSVNNVVWMWLREEKNAVSPTSTVALLFASKSPIN